jgi:hypothetical protein
MDNETHPWVDQLGEERVYVQYMLFIILSVNLESKLCIYIHSIYLTLGYQDIEDWMGFINFIFSCAFFVAYIIYHLTTISEINQLMNFKDTHL